jgi:hypothetical protein
VAAVGITPDDRVEHRSHAQIALGEIGAAAGVGQLIGVAGRPPRWNLIVTCESRAL